MESHYIDLLVKRYRFRLGAVGLGFKSRAVQIGHSVANASPPLRHFLERSCAAQAQ